MSAKKQTIKRACIDCHFLVEKQDDTEEAGLEPHEMDPRITYYCVEANKREPIRSNDYSWIKFPLVCYRGCWTEVYDKEKQHEEVVEKDRRDCPLAYPYTEGMSFEVAKEMHDKKQSNKTEAVVEPVIESEEANREIDGEVGETIEGDEPRLIIDDDLRTLEFKSEVKLEPIVFALFKFLYVNQDRLITSLTIHNRLWPEMQNAGSVNDQQIYQHISALRTALKSIGLECEIIETKNKSKFNEGGYIFHGNMIH